LLNHVKQNAGQIVTETYGMQTGKGLQKIA